MNRACSELNISLYYQNQHAVPIAIGSIRQLNNNFVRLNKFLRYVILVIISVGILEAQQPQVHEKRIYRSPDGKLYIQKSLPVYVWIATSPDENAEAYLLHSQSTPKYTNPMYFDTDGWNSFRSPWQVDTVTKKPAYPKDEIIFEVYADNDLPASSIHYENNDVKKIKNKTYIRGKANISLQATDKLSGIENIYYSVDHKNYQAYTTPFSLETEKEYVLKYYSADNVGNVEPIHEIAVVPDFTPPKTIYSIKGNVYENILAGNASIQLSADDTGSGVAKTYFKLDNGNDKIYNSAISAISLEQGEHKITFYSTDLVNNKENENTFEFYIDKTPPTLIQEITGKSFVANGKEFTSGRSQLKITAFDNKAGVKEIFYSINNGKYILYEKPVTLANSSGTLSVKSYAKDNVNNTGYYNDEDNKNRSRNLSYIDLSGPTLSNNFTGPIFIDNDSVYISPKTKILLKAYDNESGLNRIEYIVNRGETKVYSDPVQIESEGNYKIDFTAFDNVDNTNNGNVSFIVDNTGPEITCQFSTPPKYTENSGTDRIDIFPSHVVIFVAATDKFTGFDRMAYSFNSQPEKPFTGFISSIPKQKLNTLLIKAYDKLGNETQKTIKFGKE